MTIVLRMSKELHLAPRYYLVDYDFINLQHDRRRYHFYQKLRKLLGKPVKEYASTMSVIITADRNLAVKIYNLVLEHSGIANLREAKTIRP